MPRPVTLFTGQFADLPFTEICRKAADWGYDGLEIACWGDHFDVAQAVSDPSYVKERRRLHEQYGLGVWAIGNHLVGQAVCDLIDERHKSILPPEIWGDGEPEGVRKRAAQRMIDTAKAARKMRDAGPEKIDIPAVVNGFTGSSIWHSIYAFPPTSQEYWQKGFDDFATRWTPILNEFDKLDVNFGLEVHPTEIAFDIASTQRAIDAIKGHKRFGFNYDPSHLGYQGVDYVRFIYTFGKRIFHCHIKDAWWGKGTGEVGVFGGHTTFADPRRFWDFRSPGHGDVDFKRIVVALNDVGYQGPLSVEWEDSRMDREFGAAEACQMVKRIDFKPSAIAFDAQFDR